MALIDTLNQLWSIRPESFNEIKNIIDSHSQGGKLNLKEIEGKVIGFDGLEAQSSIMDGEIKVIPVKGVMEKNPSAFDRIFFGAISTQSIRDEFLKAVNDSSVKAIVFDIDSPGGTVDGVKDLADAVYESRGVKPVVAFSDGGVFSAAYWLASAADEIIVSNSTNQVGSVGVVTTHASYEKMAEIQGIKITEVYAGKYKRIVSQYKDLDLEGKEYLQDKVNYIYSLFVDDIARNRGASVETVLDKMADGKVFFAEEAIKAGMVDGVETYDRLIQRLQEDSNMNLEDLKTKHPELYESVKAEGKNEIDVEKIKAEAKQAEVDRIKGVKEALIPGHEALIDAMVFDGKTTPAEAMAAIIKAENSVRADQKKKLGADAVQPVDTGLEITGSGENAEKDFEALVSEYIELKKCSNVEAIKAVAREYPEEHAAYIKKLNGGK